MINKFEISHIEMNYILNFLKEFYIKKKKKLFNSDEFEKNEIFFF